MAVLGETVWHSGNTELQVGASQLALTVVTWAFAGSSDTGQRCCSGWQQLRLSPLKL